MPRRNFHILFLVTIVSVACALQSDREGRLLTYAMRQIDQRHLEKVDREDLFEGAMQGMIKKLQEDYADEHTAYFPPDAAQIFNEELDYQFGGVGMNVTKSKETGQITVVSPLIDTPAYRAGILAGDVILKIDGHSTEEMSLADAVKLMHGEVGDPVTITVLHKGETEPVDMTIERAIIKVDTVLGNRRLPDGTWDFFLEGEDRIGYVWISTVSDGTCEELHEAINGLIQQGMQGLIIDLRFNAGGYLHESVAICDIFVNSGTIVSTRGRTGETLIEYTASSGQKYSGFPIAILINKYSASAAEIIAACLQDHHCAVIIGQRSYGKGTVQEMLYLDAQRGSQRGLLKVTSSSYWRPSEVNINRGKDAKDEDDWGVRPDKGYEVIVKDDDMMKLLRTLQQHQTGAEEEEETTAPPADQKEDEPTTKSSKDEEQPSADYPEKSSDEKSDEKTPKADDEPFFDPQLDAAIKYLQEQITKEQHER